MASPNISGWHISLADIYARKWEIPFLAELNRLGLHFVVGSLPVYELVQRRLAILRELRTSTWDRISLPPGTPHPGPRILAVIDEFANLADALEGKQREALWRVARMVAAEGRKTDIHLALGLQDPSHKSIDLRIRRNCTSVAFRVKDADASRLVLSATGRNARWSGGISRMAQK